jgi:hypothetical protein
LSVIVENRAVEWCEWGVLKSVVVSKGSSRIFTRKNVLNAGQSNPIRFLKPYRIYENQNIIPQQISSQDF